MVEVLKGRTAFKEFLDTELSTLNMSHWYTCGTYGEGPFEHFIGMTVEKQERFLFWRLTRRRCIKVAEILAEPDSRIPGGRRDSLIIRVKYPDATSKMMQLCEKFEGAGFKMAAQVVY